MKQVLFRLLAYIVAGLSLGATAWFVLFEDAVDGGIPVAVVLALAAGGVAAAILLLMRASAVVHHGIRINPPPAVAAMDGVSIIASAMATFFTIDGYSDRFASLAPRFMDPLVADVIAFMFLPALLVLALFVTTSGGQSIAIDGTGLVVAGPFGAKKVAWDKIEKLTSNDQYVVVSRLGFPVPTHLRTNLGIATTGGEILTVYQPEFKATARDIFERMREHAPRRLSQDLDEIEAAWL